MKSRRIKSRRSLPGGAARRNTGRQRGFAYLIALFLALTVIIASQVAVQNILTAGRRDREEDMIWRGNQYARAIRLYYRKAGHYPQNLEELEKGLPELHFLRFAATKDPMSATDGEWGLIYVNAAGQIIGSVKYASLQQMALMDLNGGKLPGAPVLEGAVTASSLAVSPGLSTSGASSSPSASANPQSSDANSSAQAAPGSSPGGAPGAVPAVVPVSPFAGAFGAAGVTAQKPTGPVDGPVLGAFLTGVVSKSARRSVKVYKGGKKYSEWEFIWNPLEDQARAVQQGLAPQGGVPGLPSQPAGGIGGAFGLPSGTSSGSAGAPGGIFAPGSPGANPAPSQ